MKNTPRNEIIIQLSTGKTIYHVPVENGSWDARPCMSRSEYAEYLQKMNRTIDQP